MFFRADIISKQIKYYSIILIDKNYTIILENTIELIEKSMHFN